MKYGQGAMLALVLMWYFRRMVKHIFFKHHGYPLHKKEQEAWFLVWFTLVWSIRLYKNSIMFREEDLDKDSLLDLIKVIS